MARDDYRSPMRSRSFSRSPPPRDEREYRRSPSPRENGRSPQDERDFAPSRSLSPRGNNRSLSRSRSYRYEASYIFSDSINDCLLSNAHLLHSLSSLYLVFMCHIW